MENKKNKLKYISIGVFLLLIIEITLWLTVFSLYKKWFFSDKWTSRLGIISLKKINQEKIDIDQLSIVNLQRKISVDRITSADKSKKNLEWGFRLLDTWDKIIFKIENKLNKRDIKNYFFFKSIDNNINDPNLKTFVLKALKLYLLKNNLDLNNFNYDDFYSYLTDKLFYQEYFRTFFNNYENTFKLIKKLKLWFENNYNNFYKELKENIEKSEDEVNSILFFNNKKKEITKYIKEIETKIERINNDYCYNYFCKSKDQYLNKIYLYIKQAILSDKNLYYYLDLYSKKYNIDIRIPLAVLIIENERQHTSYKWLFKQFFAGLKIPRLSIMSKFSYGLFWIKLGTVERIINSSTDIKDNELIDIRNRFFKFDKEKKKFVLIDWKRDELIKFIVKNKKIQVLLFYKLLSIKSKEYKQIWINLNNKPWILATIWNIGWIKPAHKNPDTGGARLSFLWYKIWFGDLAEIIVNSMEMDNIITILRYKYGHNYNKK